MKRSYFSAHALWDIVRKRRRAGSGYAGDLQLWRNRLLDGLLAVVLVLGLIVVLPSMVLLAREGHWGVVLADALTMGCLGILHFRRSVPYLWRVGVFLLVTYCISVVLLFTVGTVAQIYLMVVPLLCTVLIGNRVALAALLWCSATLFAAGYMGGLDLGVAALAVSPLLHWFIMSANFFLVAAVLMVSCAYLLHGLNGALAKQRASHARIQENEARYRETLETQIAALHEREAALRVSETRYAAIFNVVPEYLTMSRISDGTIIEANLGFEQLTGWSRAEAIGRTSIDLGLLTPQTRARVLAALDSGVRMVRGLEGEMCTKDGSLRQVMISAARFELDGEHYGLSIVQDVTEAHERELALRESMAAQRAAEVSNQLKSEFLAMISHEVRTPLGGVIGMLRSAQKDDGLSEATRTKLHISLSNANGLLQIINDLLDISKLEAGKMVMERMDFDLPTLVRDVVSLLAERAEAKGVSLTAEIDPALAPWWRGDPTRLRQVVTNLIGNAIKFTERGEVCVGLAMAPHGIAMTVRDSGIGMDTDAIGRLFQKFEQADASTSRKYGGTGLGLAICKNIVDAMGGHITVESALGEGTCFQIFLPLIPGVPVQPGQQAALRAHAGRLAVLCAEDGSTNQIILRELLCDMGHAVTFAADGVDALAALATHDYDLLLLDSRMPRMDGLTVLRHLRAGEHGVRDPALPVVALTANATLDERERFMAAGADGFLVKPIDERDLHREIARQIEALHARGRALVGDKLATQAGAPSLAALDALFGLADTVPEGPSPALRAAFRAEAPRLVAALRQGLEAGDAVATALKAHSLKGSASYFGAEALCALCAEIETLADAGQLVAARDRVGPLGVELAQVLAHLA